MTQVILRWGDPLFTEGPAFDPETDITLDSQVRAAGDNTDGMEVFSAGNRTVLAVTNEDTNLDVLLPAVARRIVV